MMSNKPSPSPPPRPVKHLLYGCGKAWCGALAANVYITQDRSNTNCETCSEAFDTANNTTVLKAHNAALAKEADNARQEAAKMKRAVQATEHENRELTREVEQLRPLANGPWVCPACGVGLAPRVEVCPLCVERRGEDA